MAGSLQRPLGADQVSVEDGCDVGNREALHDARDQRCPTFGRQVLERGDGRLGGADLAQRQVALGGCKVTASRDAPQFLQHLTPQPCRRAFRMTQLCGALGAGCHGRRGGLGGTRPVSERDQQCEAVQPSGVQIPECRAEQVRFPDVVGRGGRGRGRLLRCGLGRQGGLRGGDECSAARPEAMAARAWSAHRARSAFRAQNLTMG